MSQSGEPVCEFCGGIHYGSVRCPYRCVKCGGDIRVGHRDTSSNLGRSFECLGADDITELGGLSADERDRLAADLQREQQAVNDIGDLASALRRQMEVEQQRRYGTDPTATTASRSETTQREHVTDGSPCWCKPTIEDYRLTGTTIDDFDPDAVVPGIDATTGLSLHTPIGPPLPRLGNRLRLFAEKVVPASLRSSLFEIADAIDRDAASTEPR